MSQRDGRLIHRHQRPKLVSCLTDKTWHAGVGQQQNYPLISRHQSVLAISSFLLQPYTLYLVSWLLYKKYIQKCAKFWNNNVTESCPHWVFSIQWKIWQLGFTKSVNQCTFNKQQKCWEHLAANFYFQESWKFPPPFQTKLIFLFQRNRNNF